MQLYALDAEGTPTRATSALKKCDYKCLECQGTVRRREGEQMQAHFYHLNPPISCRQSGKSLTHLAIQNRIAKELPKGQIVLEKHFSSIGRIADLAWDEEKLIFEVQCSPMTREEMLQRTNDYGSLGYQVVWILHERNYNKFRITHLEAGIAPIPHYYTDINPSGEGVIYDQWHLSSQGVRLKGLPRLSIDISRPSKLSCMDKSCGSTLADSRIASWKLHFKGDLIDLALNEPASPYLQSAKASEKEVIVKKESLFSKMGQYYHAILLKILKGYCS